MERQAAFADGEWENELARSILILYGSAMGCGKEIAGQENDFAVDNDAVKAAVAAMLSDIDPVEDNRGPVAFKRHVAGVILARAIDRAWSRA